MLTDSHSAPLILVVEDDTSHSELIVRSFMGAPEEFCLEVVTTICAAIDVAERRSPNLVLTDYRLPDGDGSELVVLAAGLWPVIMMTSQGNEQVAVEVMKIGAQDYIIKSPDAFENLPRTVRHALITWELITARRHAAAASLRAKKDWERTFNAVPELISIIDSNYTVTRVNKAMADRCGLAIEDIIGRKCFEVVHGLHEAPHCCQRLEMIQDCLVHATEIEEKKLGGFFDITISPLTDDEGRITSYVHVMRDITERKQSEDQRLKLEQKFQQSQKLESLGVLAGGIAHDFNNILTIIMGHCFMVKENCDSAMTDKDHVLQIEAAGNRAADLCRQMLAYAGSSPLVNVQVNLWLLIDEIVKMLQSAIKKNVVIKLDLRRDVPEIFGDNAQIQQVVMNLFINAAEAIGDSIGTITVTLKKAVIQKDQPELDYMGNAILEGMYARLEVSDNGCGMDEDTQKKIFEPFYTTKFTGRGLGMSAVLGIIKSHDGALQLSSSPGVGTTFKVFFPLPDKKDVAETALATGSFSLAKGSGTILLVDDEEALRTIGSALLGSMGFAVISAANGREAIEAYKACDSVINLVMLDLTMPEMGGVTAYHELRALEPTVPILFCSGYGAESASDITATDRHSRFLHKPYSPLELLRVLNELIGG